MSISKMRHLFSLCTRGPSNRAVDDLTYRGLADPLVREALRVERTSSE